MNSENSSEEFTSKFFAAFKLQNENIVKEGEYVNAVLDMMSDCIDNWRLRFNETGFKDESEPTQCFKTCITDDYKKRFY